MGNELAQETWEAALNELQRQVNKPNYRTWFEKTVGLSYQDNHFIIGVPNTFVAEYLDKNQRSLIEKTLTGIINADITLSFRVAADQSRALASPANRRKIPLTQMSLPLLNPRYTFDTFVVGTSNRMAHAASLEITKEPGHSYNPLFICGETGLGKTHLLQAIGHAALSNTTHLLYISAEQFTTEFIIAIRQKKTEEFRSKYRAAEMLLIDDINFISGKVQTEESFSHLFNELHNANRQIVLTGSCPPKGMPRLDDRLRSRFEGGLVTEIQPPDFDTRLAIIQAKAQQTGLDISLDVLEFLAQRLYQNIRELEGCINRIIAYAKLVKPLLTPELAAEALEDIAGKAANDAPVTPTRLIETVATSFQLTSADIFSRNRDKQTTLARQVAMYLLRQETGWSLVQIGKELGGREPITVSSACKKIANIVSTDPDFRRRISGIQETLHQTSNPQ